MIPWKKSGLFALFTYTLTGLFSKTAGYTQLASAQVRDFIEAPPRYMLSVLCVTCYVLRVIFMYYVLCMMYFILNPIYASICIKPALSMLLSVLNPLHLCYYLF
jgi:hypothetical protein